MAYRFQSESVEEGVRRIAVEQLGGAVDDLGGRGDAGERIHEARKRIKKTRGLLRLSRGAMGDRRRAENDRLRRLAKRLDAPRDADAALEAFDALARDGAGGDAELAGVRAALDERRDRIAGDRFAVARRIAEVRDELRQIAEEAGRWRIDGDGFAALAPGLRRTYRQARDAFRRARESPERERLHEWRKRVKDHWYHVRLLSPMWPPVLKGRAEALRTLSKRLGDDRDLVLLEDALDGLSPRVSSDARERLRSDAAARRRELQRDAVALSERLFAEKPKQLARRMERCWSAWEREARAVRDDAPPGTAYKDGL